LPHKYISKEDLQKIENTVKYYDDAISRLHSYHKKDKDGVQKVLELIKDLRDAAKSNKNAYLTGKSNEDRIQAQIHHYEELAYATIIQLYENPRERINYYKRTRQEYKERLAELKHLEVR